MIRGDYERRMSGNKCRSNDKEEKKIDRGKEACVRALRVIPAETKVDGLPPAPSLMFGR